MAKNQVVPITGKNELSERKKIIKDLYKVEGTKDVYFVKYEDGGKELIYTYKESDIVPKDGIMKLDVSEYNNCIKIYEFGGIDYAIFTKIDGFVYVMKLPEKTEIFKLFGDTAIQLNRIDERYILINAFNLDNRLLYDAYEGEISHTITKSVEINKISDYYVLSKSNFTGNNDINYENIIFDRNWKKVIQVDGFINIYGDKLVKKSNDSIEVYELEKKDKERRIFSRQDWHIYKPICIFSRGEIITFEQGQISIFDVDFNKKEMIEIPNLNGEISTIDTDGNNLLMIYCKNVNIFLNLDTKAVLQYSDSIWRFPYNNPSAFIGINNEEQRIYHIHDKNFKEVVSIEIAEYDLDKGPREPLYEDKEGCIFAIENIENKWVLINTIIGKSIEMDGYNAFFEGIDCICGIKKIEEKDEKYVVDVYDLKCEKRVSNFDCQKYGLYIMGKYGRLPIQLIGNCLYYKGRYDVGTLQDLRPEYIFGSDGQKIFGFDRNQIANANKDERLFQRTMLDSNIFLREISGQKFFKIVSPQNNECWFNSENCEFYILNGR